MTTTAENKSPRKTPRAADRPQRGVITVLAAFVLVAAFAFVAFAVDTGRIATTQTNMQNAVDAAALAASQEINAAVAAAGAGGASATIDANSIAVVSARAMAQQVAEANGTYIDPNADVTFGKRTYDPASSTWSITWGASPYNVVKVAARRDQANSSAPDSEFPLAFGWAVGKSRVKITTSSTAFVEARDLVLCMDYSGSMNDDSTIAAFSRLGQSNVEANLDQIWNALVSANPKFPGSTKSKFPSTGFGSVNSAAGTYVSSTNSETVFNTLQLGATDSSGALKHPFPQAGRNSNGSFNGLPSASTSKTKWKAYISYVMSHSNSTYKRKYGYRTLMDYLMTQKPQNVDSEDLWRTPHYPFDSIKQATSLFTTFLTDLNFGDELGYVNYADSARTETSLNEDGYSINIASNPITNDYAAIDTIQRHKQAGHYQSYTGTGYGIKEARTLLANSMRYGARPTIFLMSDGLANRYPSGWNLPSGWNWNTLTDYDGDGTADYTTTDKSKQYAFYEAKLAVDAGHTLHTLSVGIQADKDFMEALAFMGGGTWIDVPGNTTVAAMQAQITAAFRQIAAKVPPPKLVDSASASGS